MDLKCIGENCTYYLSSDNRNSCVVQDNYITNVNSDSNCLIGSLIKTKERQIEILRANKENILIRNIVIEQNEGTNKEKGVNK